MFAGAKRTWLARRRDDGRQHLRTLGSANLAAIDAFATIDAPPAAHRSRRRAWVRAALATRDVQISGSPPPHGAFRVCVADE
jgi:hypothetical protein